MMNNLTAHNAYEFVKEWQTLIGACLALLAAWIAARPVLRQLNEHRRQAASAAVEMIVKAATALEDEKIALSDGQRSLERLAELLRSYDYDSPHDIYEAWPKKVWDLIDTCDKLKEQLMRYAVRNPHTGGPQQQRTVAISALETLRGSIGKLSEVFHHSTIGPSYEDGELDIPDGEDVVRRTQIDLDFKAWRSTSTDLASALNTEIIRIWKRVRELEQVAIG